MIIMSRDPSGVRIITRVGDILTRFFEDLNAKVYVAGHRGLVGSALVRALKERGYTNLLLRRSDELDLRKGTEVISFFEKERPKYVFLAAAKVGGILANSTYPADFIYDNIAIASNVIHASFLSGVDKLLFLGSSCIYPRECPQPIKEEYLLTGPLESTSEPYAIAKIAGIKLCQAYNWQHGTRFISAMPTNLYGPGDNFDLKTSHVLPALIRKFHEAKVMNKPFVEIWGTGKPLREFLFVDDLADACLFLMDCYEENEPINVGTGKDISIRELAMLVAGIVGYDGELTFNTNMPDGTPRKLLDVTKLRSLGWLERYNLKEGIRLTYEWYQEHMIHNCLPPSVR